MLRRMLVQLGNSRNLSLITVVHDEKAINSTHKILLPWTVSDEAGAEFGVSVAVWLRHRREALRFERLEIVVI